MKKQLTLLLLAACLWFFLFAPYPVWADDPFGAVTPETPNSAKQDDNSGGPGAVPLNDVKEAEAGATASSNNTPADTTPSGSAQSGGTITDQLNTGAYAEEKSAAQQIIEGAAAQYSGPRLSSLSLDAATLTPAFSQETFAYAAYVAEGVNSLLLTAVAASGTIYINGQAGAMRRLELNSDESTVRIQVVEGEKSATYTLLILRNPTIAQPISTIPLITRIQISNEEFIYECPLTAADGVDITLELPQATSKKVKISVTVNTDALVYYNNIRVYNAYYHADNGYWTVSRECDLMPNADSLLGVHLTDTQTKAVLNYYSLRIAQPRPGQNLRIQLQVGNEQAVVNEELRILDAPPLIMESHTVVPLRFIAEALGAKVNWSAEEQRVDIQSGGRSLSLFIGKQSNGLPLAPFIESGRTMVPLRYVSEQLDCQVEWLAATREIIITR